MGVEWWGSRHDGDKDEWQSNWDNWKGYEEDRVKKQGSKENRVEREGSEENNRGGDEGIWVKIKGALSEGESLRLSGYRSDRFEDDEKGRSPNDA